MSITAYKVEAVGHDRTGKDFGYRDSIILLEQLRTIDKSRLRDKLGSLGEDQMCKLDHALEVSVGLLPIYNTI